MIGRKRNRKKEMIWAACGASALWVSLWGGQCFTVIGIPFGLQQFKLARLALMPFGAQVTG